MTATPLHRIADDVYSLGPWGWARTCVHFVGNGSTWVLVDAGWPGDGPRIRQAWQQLAPPGVRPAAILLTHDHPDHAGAVRELVAAWQCPVYLHPEELPIAAGDFEAMQRYAGPLDRWVILPVMRALGSRRREKILRDGRIDDLVTLLPSTPEIPHLPDWRWLPTPGHTPGHVSFHRPADGVLLTGDAVITVDVNSPLGLLRRGERGYRPPWYTTWDPDATAASIARLADLEPRVLASGHGRSLSGPAATDALRALAQSVRRPG